MNPQDLLSILHVAEKLKCNTRHCDTSSGRRESVAEHSWRMSLMAMLISDEFPEADMNKVIRMCIIHDLGEAFTGDIPTFLKTDENMAKEDEFFNLWVATFPSPAREEFQDLLYEMDAQETVEAKIYKSLDKLEAVIQHDESSLDSWLPLEYDLQLTYATETVAFSDYLTRLKEEVDQWTRRKIAEEGRPKQSVGYTVMHEGRGNMRVRLHMKKIEAWQSDLIKFDLKTVPGVSDVVIYESTAGVSIRYTCPRQAVINKLNSLDPASLITVREFLDENRDNEEKLGLDEFRKRKLDADLKKRMRIRMVTEAAADMILPEPVQLAYHLYQLITLKNM